MGVISEIKVHQSPIRFITDDRVRLHGISHITSRRLGTILKMIKYEHIKNIDCSI